MGRLIDLETVVIEEVGDDELPMGVLRLRLEEDCVEPETDLLVDPFEEVLLRRLGDESVDVAK